MFTPNLIVGLAIMAIGIVLILDRLGFASVMDVLQYWPVVLVLFGASVAMQAFRRRDPSVPPPRPVIAPGFVLFVVIVAMIATSGFRGWDTQASTNAERINVFGVMGSTSRTATSNFRDAHVGGVMGRSTLDLRQATIAPGQDAVVDVFVAMGKVVVRVPDDWTVDTSALPVMGAVEDLRWPGQRDVTQPPPASVKVEPTSPADVEAVTPPAGPVPRLVLRGFVMMGKVEIQS